MTTTKGSNPLREALIPDPSPDRPLPMDWNEYEDKVMRQWRALLDSDPEEDRVQEFLELHPSMIPGGSGDIGPGGNHGSEMGAVFRMPELQGLGRRFLPDFMWVGRSSGVITPILIEIEKPSKKWFTLAGQPTADFTQAHDQLTNWRAWFSHPENALIFRKKYIFDNESDHLWMRPQYVLVYGRRSEFDSATTRHKDPKTLDAKRDLLRGPDETFMSFDALRPRAESRSAVTVNMTANGPRAFALAPHFGTDTRSGRHASTLGSLDEALGRAVMMTQERKEYIAQRWAYWQGVQARIDADQSGVYIRRAGRE